MVLVDVIAPAEDGTSVSLLEPLEVSPSTTIAELQQALQTMGFPLHMQALGVIPRQLLAWDEVVDARSSSVHLVDARRTLDHYVATDDSELAAPTHGFVPLSKREETLELRQRMKELEELLGASGAAAADANEEKEQEQELLQLVQQEKHTIEQEIARTTDMEVYATLRQAIYNLRNEYQSIFMSTLRLVRHAERDALERLGLITAKIALEQGCESGNAFFKQSSPHIIPLMRAAHQIKRELFDPYFNRYAAKHANAVQFFPAAVKGVWRTVEKAMAKKNSIDSFESVCDFVRGAIASASLNDLVNVVDQLDSDSTINVLRIKNRFRKPDDTSWADCIVNFTFLSDEGEHICELQLVHVQVMRARRKMGARSTFPWYRSACELLRRDARWRDEQRVIELYNKTDGENWKESQSWCSIRPLSRWARLSVRPDGRISELLLNENGLHGRLPRGIGKLTCLVRLELSHSKLPGPIPEEIGNLTALEHLNMSFCNLHGRIPERMGNMISLKVLILAANKLEGQIPDSLGLLSNLEELDLCWNDLSGEVPESFCGLVNLKQLILHDNALEINFGILGSRKSMLRKRLNKTCAINI